MYGIWDCFKEITDGSLILYLSLILSLPCGSPWWGYLQLYLLLLQAELHPLQIPRLKS